ncbi:MAG: fatty acid desaturase [Myxococcaceae bacterium]|nr:fatty acid desaturase [Myxococcaceae bacterium]
MKRLRAELKAARVFEHHAHAGWVKLALMVAVTLGCCAGVAFGPTWSWFLLVPAAALATTTATLIGHEGGHGSFSSRSGENMLLAYITLPLFAGISALYWKHKHNGLHHGHPNVVGADPDIELWPMASSRAEYERAGKVLRWFQRNTQGYLFWPASSTLSTMMRIPSYLFVVRQLRTRGATRPLVLDAACLVGHYALWVGLPGLYFGFLPAFALYMVIWALVGSMLAVIFSPAHLGLPLLVDQHHDWRHQLETTRNIRAPGLLSYFYVGLDYQIEHHIFPQIPHQNLPRASAIMKRWCAEVGLPHREIGWVAGMVSVTRFVRDAWKLDASTSSPAPQRPSFGEAAREPRSFGARLLPTPPAAAKQASSSDATTGELASDLVC